MKIYKYASVSSAILILKNETLRLTAPKDFNDPFDSDFYSSRKEKNECFDLFVNYSFLRSLLEIAYDGKIQLPKAQQAMISGFKKEYDLYKKLLRKNPFYSSLPGINGLVNQLAKSNESLSSLLAKGKEEYEEEIQSIFDSIESIPLITCFSQRNDSTLMWSHYASSHHGVCLEFEKPRSNDVFDVIYQTKRAPFDFRKILSHYLACQLLSMKFDMSNKAINDAVVAPLITKSADWSYEKETRIIKSKADAIPQTISDVTSYYMKVPKITRVYVGCNAAGEELDHLLWLASNRNIPIIFMKKSENDYAIVPDNNRKAKADHWAKRTEIKDSTLLLVEREIDKCLDAKAYLSAFRMALMVPALCGQIEYPNISDERKRYIKWVDEYCPCAGKSNFQDGEVFARFSGEACWSVNEALTNRANINVAGRYDDFNLKSIRLVVQGKKDMDFYGGNSEEKNSVDLDIQSFCFFMKYEADLCYERHPKEVEALPKIPFFDYDQAVENISEMNIARERRKQG